MSLRRLAELPLWARIPLIAVPLGVLTVVALYLKQVTSIVVDVDKLNDVACKHRTTEDGQRPAHCPALPPSASKETVKEIREARASIESELKKIVAPPPLAREQQFRIEPTTWLNGQLGLKLIADSRLKGTLSVAACDRFAAMYSWVGDVALDSSKAEKTFKIGFKEPAAVLIAQVRPEGAMPFAVITVWDLSNLTLMKTPVARDGVFDCRENMGKY